TLRPNWPPVHPGTLRDEVDDLALRHVATPPSGPSRPSAEIHFFKVKKKALVQQSDMFKHCSAHHEARAGHPIDRIGVRADWWRDDVAPQQAGHRSETKPVFPFA